LPFALALSPRRAPGAEAPVWDWPPRVRDRVRAVPAGHAVRAVAADPGAPRRNATAAPARHRRCEHREASVRPVSELRPAGSAPPVERLTAGPLDSGGGSGERTEKDHVTSRA